jgi:hypothetical protein
MSIREVSMNLLCQLWRDEGGGLQSCELVFLSAILIIGVVPGIALVRDALVCELEDIACAISAVDCWEHDHDDGGHGHNWPPPGRGWHRGWHHGHWNAGGSQRGVVTAGQLFPNDEQ